MLFLTISSCSNNEEVIADDETGTYLGMKTYDSEVLKGLRTPDIIVNVMDNKIIIDDTAFFFDGCEISCDNESTIAYQILTKTPKIILSLAYLLKAPMNWALKSAQNNSYIFHV